MNIEDLGWKHYIQLHPELSALPEAELGRVAIEHKTGYTLFTSQGDLEGLLPRVVRFKTSGVSALPKVGDWVTFAKVPNEDKAVITKVLPRNSVLARIVREDTDRTPSEQVMATNIDTAFLVQGLDENFNAPRFELFLGLVQKNGITPIILLNKIDLVADTTPFINQVKHIAPNVSLLPLSTKTGVGTEELRKYIQAGRTTIFLGVSGVGKSSIVNALSGEQKQATLAVRKTDARGRHTTTRREMILLPGGGIVIDTPGIRDLQFEQEDDSLSDTFEDLLELARHCKFRDCDHEVSKGCKIITAVAEGEIPPGRYHRFLKRKQEREHQERSFNIRGMQERKAKNKTLHKNLRKIIKHKRGYF